MTVREYDDVVLIRDLPEEGLLAGEIGTVVHIYSDGPAYEVEFGAPTESRVAAVDPDAVRRLDPNEIHDIRRFTIA